MKRIIALILSMMLALCALPAALAESAYYTGSTPVSNATVAQYNNIMLAADALNGWYIPAGGTFSFNDAVGPRTTENGYVTAKNGRGADYVGGGVSQVATTLYLALLQIPGIRYTQITTYGDRFTAGYVSDGALALVTDYEAGVDFAFTAGSDPLTIRCWSDGEYFYCEVEAGGAGQSAYGNQGVLLGCASFDISGSDGLINNISRAAESANGTVLATGQVFSFNDVIGPRTEAYGYVSAVNGRGVNVVGGGVAQVASVMWLAVKDMDTMTVTEKSTYGKRYNQSYVRYAEDAIVTDWNAGTDFAFRYDGEGSVTISVYIADSTLVCEIWAGDTAVSPTVAPADGGSSSGGLSW